jgi:hypothetical protein
MAVTAVVKRWMKLDYYLYRRRTEAVGLTLARLAAICGVDEKTIKRDLRAFKALGYEAAWYEPEEGSAARRWRYPRGRPPMFTASLPASTRKGRGAGP